MTDDTDKPTLLSESEIVRELRRLRHDPANRRGKARVVPIRWVAQQAGVNRARIYRIIREGCVSSSSREALSPVLIMLQERV